MNYYPHHIGDYTSATAHLTWTEDTAYRRLLDLYYMRERPIPGDITEACRLVRAKSRTERKAVEMVLKEFFSLGQNGWQHTRCVTEIEKFSKSAHAARENGNKGGRPKKTKNINEINEENNPVGFSGLRNENPDETQAKAPRTRTKVNPSVSSLRSDTVAAEKPATTPVQANPDLFAKPEPPPKTPDQLTRDELWSAGKSLLIQSGIPERQCGSIVGKLVRDYGDQIVVEAVRTACVDRPADPVGYLKACCRNATGQRQARPNGLRTHAMPADFKGLPTGMKGGKPIPVPDASVMEGMF